MLKPAYALVGDDVFLQLQALSRLVEEARDIERLDADGETAEIKSVLDDLRSFAMFGGSKMVVVRNADDFVSRYRELLETFLQEGNATGTLVLRMNSLPANQRIHKIIAKVGEIVSCKAPERQALSAWVVQHAKTNHALQLDKQSADLIAELIGSDLGKIDNELAKLALQVTSKKVTPADVAASISFQRDQEMWAMTDELTAGRPAKALERWRNLLRTDPSSEFRAMTWLTIWLEKVVKARALAASRTSPNAIAAALKIWPAYNVEHMLRIGEKLGDDGMRQAAKFLADLDRRTKSGLGDATRNIERFVLSLAQLT